MITLPYTKELFMVPRNLCHRHDEYSGPFDSPDGLCAEEKICFLGTDAQPSLLEPIDNIETINKRIEFLYDRDHMIGHAYFINARNSEDIIRTLKSKIIPLVQKYFYDDWEKIGLILGGIGRNENDPFIIYKKELLADELFRLDGVDNDYGSKTKYFIRSSIGAEEVKKIYED